MKILLDMNLPPAWGPFLDYFTPSEFTDRFNPEGVALL